MKPFNNTSNQGLGGLFAVLLGLLSMNAAHAQIFVVNTSADTIGEYTNSGATVNASLVSGLNGPFGIAVSAPVPEPSTYAMMLAGLGLIGFIAYRRKSNSSNMLMAA
jgi:hypothetical protein